MKLFSKIQKRLQDKKARLILPNLDIYCRFFKPADYADEKEYRLFVSEKRSDKTVNSEWTLNGYGIFNPHFDMPNQDFDYVIEEIMLGPKAVEPELNRAQLKHYLKTQGRNGIAVEVSGIKHYR